MTVEIKENIDNNVLRVFIVRHGQTDHNVKKIIQGHLDAHLNDTGRVQAKQVANGLSKITFDEFVSSDLVRCRHTLEAIQAVHPNVPVRYTVNLRERNMGHAEGLPIQEAILKYGEDFRNLGEHSTKLQARIEVEWNRILKENPNGKNVIVCTHGGVITSFTNFLYDKRNYKLHENITKHDLRVPFNTSVTVVDIDKETKAGIIQTFGNTDHLGGQFEVQDQRLR